MALFGNLFEKKYCDICGEEIKLLGNRKLENGNLCKNCAAKLSPWFDERRHSTVEQIREQLEYREQNRARVQNFNTTLSLGNGSVKLLADENGKTFMVTSSKNFEKDNPDVVDFSQITGCNLDIKESQNELKRTVDGKSVSYNPPRYEYSYNFYAEIRVNSPWFDTMRFQLNSSSIRTGERRMTGGAEAGWHVRTDGNGIRQNLAMDEYYKYIDLGNEIKERLEKWRTGAFEAAPAQSPAMEPISKTQDESWTCVCGAVNTGKFCEYCGSSRP